jgi:nicotinic acid mononucleotide adenylyltransferase
MVRAEDSFTPASSPSIFLIDAATADVSSTAIRARLAAGQTVVGMVEPRVRQHIEQHGLYGSPVPDRRRPTGSA